MGFFDFFNTKHYKEQINTLQQTCDNLQRRNDILQQTCDNLQLRNETFQQSYDTLQQANDELSKKLNSLNADEYFAVQEQIKQLKDSHESMLQQFNSLCHNASELATKNQKVEKQITTSQKKLNRIKELYKQFENVINNYTNLQLDYRICRLPQSDLDEAELLSPSILLKLHCMDVKDLRKAYRDNEKLILKLLEQYSSRYTTKANKTIYDLMVIALRSELQNILYNLKYEKLDISVDAVKSVTQKYMKLACEGNQNIAGTLTKFIGEIEYLFVNAVKIEYNYYVKKEQARQEQLAIKEQIRQEAEERKALAAEKAKIEKEEEKYKNELTKLNEQLIETPNDIEANTLRQRILELEAQLSNVVVKKEEITKLQNGKAGNVYIISNLGSFGENVFKIGMTRRQDPQDRINELSNASVPFKFDVHSFIFSDDAVGLEGKLHEMLNDKRVNKVNLRKEFFQITIDELEQLVNEIEPTAEFNRTMLAEEFRQSLSSDSIYTSDFDLDLDDEE
ncbi:MAG: GIY-YIG nuclease family protein [Lachnospiraceae bacterium]|nr:GIY-YIG nuclease family protein [Lachnospiraceae bacterium]MDE7200577.1 GIY-YIG nuclease family protein [Lachnospiraceae bacterium]